MDTCVYTIKCFLNSLPSSVSLVTEHTCLEGHHLLLPSEVEEEFIHSLMLKQLLQDGLNCTRFTLLVCYEQQSQKPVSDFVQNCFLSSLDFSTVATFLVGSFEPPNYSQMGAHLSVITVLIQNMKSIPGLSIVFLYTELKYIFKYWKVLSNEI